MKQQHFHGSDLEKIEQIYGIKRENITSFSSNVNPLGLSPKLKQELVDNIDVITSYPDRDYTSLRQCIGDYVEADYRNIMVGNGSTELISLFIQATKPKKVCMLGPTYSEYEREIAISGGQLEYYFLKEERGFEFDFEEFKKAISEDTDLFIICNPNNPTSTAILDVQMKKILEYCAVNQIFVMIDETYVEFAEAPERITAVPFTAEYSNLIILRGISKFFGAPGLRLGYAVCSNQEIFKHMEEKKNPWSINSLAAVAGEIIFRDSDYIKDTRQYISAERQRICERLSVSSYVKFYIPTANFVLVKIINSKITSDFLFEMAVQKGLMIRDCSTFPTLDNHFLRFCFMKREKNDELIDLLLELTDL